MNRQAITLLCIIVLTGTLHANDWPQWGRDNSRNMIAPDAKNLPAEWKAGEIGDDDNIDMKTTENVKWVAKLGSQSYGNVTVANGRVYLGTNNDVPRDKRFKGDHSVVYCLDEKTGDLLWQFTAPKIGSGKVGDWEYLGIASSPAVEGDRVYFVTNRYEVICLDAHGMANGNDGDFKDEGKYMVGLNTSKKPLEVTKTDADIIWRYDMKEDLGIFVHNITSSSVLIIGDTLFAVTSNGVDYGHTNIPNPRAPALIALNKTTGKLVGEEISGISTRIMHGNWSSPGYVEVDGKGLALYAGPDGYLYAYDLKPIPDPDDPEFNILKEVWKLDGNLPSYRFDKNGKPKKYVRPDGPSEFISTPVTANGKIYVGIGQDPEHGEGVGRFMCINPKGTGDISKTNVIWDYTGINRSISTASVVDGLVYIADYAGYIHCLDAENGKVYWKQDTLSHIWGSTLVADGKVYLGNEDGIVTVMKHGKIGEPIDLKGLQGDALDKANAELKKRGKAQMLAEVEMPASVFSSPIYANGVLYIMTGSNLYAIENKKAAE